jgi:hypothetical protein
VVDDPWAPDWTALNGILFVLYSGVPFSLALGDVAQAG